MRTFFVTLFVMASFAANAQMAAPAAPAKPARPGQSTKVEKPFKVKLGPGYATPTDNVGTDSYVKPGLAYSIEPQYELTRNLEVGVRFEQAYIKRSESLFDGKINYSTKTKSIVSGVATVNYVLDLDSKFRPYAGVGVGGYYTDASQQVYQIYDGNPSINFPLPAGVNVGGLGRVGVKYGIVYVEGTYNLVSNTTVTNEAKGWTLTAKNSYFSVSAGITIGGSR